ncbi:serine/threonine protein kinase [bacterium]|nr:serine/threonine protein kinase [bacterium]
MIGEPEPKLTAIEKQSLKTRGPIAPVDGSLPALPNVALGSLTAVIALLYLDLTMPWFQPASPLNPFSTLSPTQLVILLLAVALILVHLTWLTVSQGQLLEHTKYCSLDYLSNNSKTVINQKFLLAINGTGWLILTSACYYNYRSVNSSFHITVVWLTTIFLLYYFYTSLLHTPAKTKTRLEPEQVSKVPENACALIFFSLFTLPYIWYWKRTVASFDHSNVDQSEEKLVIPYVPLIGFERWLESRNKSTTQDNNQENLVIAFAANVLLLTPLIFYRNEITTSIKDFFAWQESSGLAATSTTTTAWHIANQALLIGAVALPIGATATLAFIILKQPTHLEFTPLGLSAFRWLGDRKWQSKGFHWSELAAIALNERRTKTQAHFSELEFVLKSGDSVTFNLNAVVSQDDRSTILKAIERWAPTTSRQAEAVQALQPPMEHSYTELWLQALLAPPQRDRLNPLTEGTILCNHRYKVTGALGVGGQGAAYEALDMEREQVIVLKEFLLPIYVDISVRKSVLDSFEREARILTKLTHNQIVKLIDFFVEDHRAYLVLEHIEGTTLAQLVINQGPLPEKLVRELATQMCTILSYLHNMEPPVVHRDFTPENLILRSDGLLKLIDFNVARQVESNATGSVVGKPAYLPTEQFRGQAVCQSDIYSMGATLSFILTGKQPEPISVSHPRSESIAVSEQLDTIVAKATAINVQDRYGDCDQILQDLLTQQRAID